VENAPPIVADDEEAIEQPKMTAVRENVIAGEEPRNQQHPNRSSLVGSLRRQVIRSICWTYCIVFREPSPEQERGSASRIDTTEDHSLVQRPSYLGDLPAELKIRPAAVVDPNTATIETPTVALPARRVTALLQ
jgi:hypothetical protein